MSKQVSEQRTEIWNDQEWKLPLSKKQKLESVPRSRFWARESKLGWESDRKNCWCAWEWVCDRKMWERHTHRQTDRKTENYKCCWLSVNTCVRVRVRVRVRVIGREPENGHCSVTDNVNMCKCISVRVWVCAYFWECMGVCVCVRVCVCARERE